MRKTRRPEGNKNIVVEEEKLLIGFESASNTEKRKINEDE